MIIKGESLPPPKELSAPVVYEDWKDVEAFADRHFELYAQTHLGRYSFRMADKRKEWSRTMKNELRVSELQELDFTQLLERESDDFLVPYSVLGPLHPAGAPPVEPFFPIDKRNGKDPIWIDAFALPWVVYYDGQSDLYLERPPGGPRIRDHERARKVQTRQMLLGKMTAGLRKRADEVQQMLADYVLPEPKFVPKSPQQQAVRSAAFRRTARNMDCMVSLVVPEQIPPRDKLSSSPSYLMEGLDHKDALSVCNFDQDSRASNAARFRKSGRVRRRSPNGPFPDTLDAHCPIEEIYVDGEPCDVRKLPKDSGEPEEVPPTGLGFWASLWNALFPPKEDGCVEIDEGLQPGVPDEEDDSSNGQLKSPEDAGAFPFSNYPGLIPSKHVLKYTWKTEVQGAGAPGLGGGGTRTAAGFFGGRWVGPRPPALPSI